MGGLHINPPSIFFLYPRLYTTYLSDGDCKSYHEIVSKNPYPGFDIRKSECVGHVQKRVGTRLQNLSNAWKRKLLKDETKRKGIADKGLLNDRVINTLQNYYGMSIRPNKEDLYGMKKAIAAIVHHCSENDNMDERISFALVMRKHGVDIKEIKLLGKAPIKVA